MNSARRRPSAYRVFILCIGVEVALLLLGAGTQALSASVSVQPWHAALPFVEGALGVAFLIGLIGLIGFALGGDALPTRMSRSVDERSQSHPVHLQLWRQLRRLPRHTPLLDPATRHLVMAVRHRGFSEIQLMHSSDLVELATDEHAPVVLTRYLLGFLVFRFPPPVFRRVTLEVDDAVPDWREEERDLARAERTGEYDAPVSELLDLSALIERALTHHQC